MINKQTVWFNSSTSIQYDSKNACAAKDPEKTRQSIANTIYPSSANISANLDQHQLSGETASPLTYICTEMGYRYGHPAKKMWHDECCKGHPPDIFSSQLGQHYRRLCLMRTTLILLWVLTRDWQWGRLSSCGITCSGSFFYLWHRDVPLP